ncbi:ABC transporter permease subunit [Winkia sp. ACRQY]|uniref:ABC transporter permease n=1 Tax=Winkia sp. ACRQY TaxID=2918182 RepID=UPI001EF37E2C|nr:ABC transporter permease subunit [Winkia sp. ACRQY]MCG7303167.1 ABC transporter permease subunit [Winkia sp. ACRQY]
MADFILQRWRQLLFMSIQHAWLAAQCVLLATLVAVALAALAYKSTRLRALLNNVSTIGLTIPSFALLALLVAPLGFGVAPTVIALVFYGALPIMRNAVVGLAGVDNTVIESARGQGMSATAIFFRVRLPLSWPLILSGIRVSTQMVMGIAAIGAYVLGPGLGSLTFTGLARLGGAGAVESAAVGTLLVVIVALIADFGLAILGRLTISRGIRD